MINDSPIKVEKNFLQITGGQKFDFYPFIYNTLPQYARYLPDHAKKELQQVPLYTEEDRKAFIKKRNQIFCKYLGPRIHRRFPQLAWKAFIEPNFDRSIYYALSNTGSNWNKFNGDRVSLNIHPDRVEKLNQLVKDNLQHLAPFVTYYNLDPSEAKKEYGKGVWKRLTSNSGYRNKALCEAQKNHDVPLEGLLDFRTGCIEKIYSRSISTWRVRDAAETEACRVSPRVADTLLVRDVINDTLGMAGTLGKDTKIGVWSWKRWQEEHEVLSQLILEGRFSSKPFCEPETHTVGGYTFERICSPMDMKKEGNTMYHCIASYTDRAKNGKYLVYKVRNKCERYTLGIYNVVDRPAVKLPKVLDQLYGKYNRAAPLSAFEASQELVDKLNKESTR